METLINILAIWFISSIPVSLLAAQFLARATPVEAPALRPMPIKIADAS